MSASHKKRKVIIYFTTPQKVVFFLIIQSGLIQKLTDQRFDLRVREFFRSLTRRNYDLRRLQSVHIPAHYRAYPAAHLIAHYGFTHTVGYAYAYFGQSFGGYVRDLESASRLITAFLVYVIERAAFGESKSVSYPHLTLQTNREVNITVVAV